jgi:hypothetical protein
MVVDRNRCGADLRPGDLRGLPGTSFDSTSRHRPDVQRWDDPRRPLHSADPCHRHAGTPQPKDARTIRHGLLADEIRRNRSVDVVAEAWRSILRVASARRLEGLQRVKL